MTIYDLDIDRAVVAIPGVETYRRTSDGLWVTPLLGQVASIDGVTEALLGSDGSTAAQFPSRVAPSGPLRRGFYFDGGDQINLGDRARYSFTNGVNDLPFSIACVLSFSSAAADGYILSKILTSYISGEYWLAVYRLGGNRLYLATVDNVTGGAIGRYGIPTTPIDSPFVFVATYSGSALTTGFKLYVSAQRIDSANLSVGVYTRMRDTAAALSIGGIAASTFQRFSGSMLVLPIIYPYELSPAEVGVITARMQLYANTPVR